MEGCLQYVNINHFLAKDFIELSWGELLVTSPCSSNVVKK